ncbi:hypothetical protein TCAL_12297 [Tigriopus californicus]|uniref:C2H2-type domain-containing protein n=1 Tax=Tigriopus californicus TaxID=6832 RepID=A0A553NFI0_TIGCA|nr:zinc finger protein 503-like [Tigriopus californicus]TRY64158.1 hypothetical protein TCAL_12297 [Tigriopus californicus]|eukprot:TCALIF_12297-PA protein Name:"Similar to znf703-b Zinc finger protein 703-B (Xenopus laevis)" AED:0.16 eAED:0.25 QI:0/0/0/0.66/1/1/3/0/440
MVILDKTSANLPSCSTMLSSSTNGNQYLNPDFLGPLPSETDSKSSPLAMLAKTCSQIGADSNLAPTSKSSQGARSSEKLDVGQESRLMPSNSPLLHGSKSEDETDHRSRSSSTEIKVSDNNKDVSSNKQSPIPRALSSASSSLSPASNFTSRRGSASPQTHLDIGRKSKSPKNKDTPAKATLTSPTGKSISDIFGASRDHPLRNLGIPDGHAPIRPMFPGTTFPPNLFTAASTNPFLASFLASSMASAVSPTSSATTVTSSSSNNQCRDPLCRDPSCATFIRNQQLLAAATGGLPSLGAYSSLIQREAILSAQRNAVMAAAAAASPPGAAGGPLPFICNWMGGSDYCGRRFASSEELLLHLKTHTNLSANSDPRPLPMLGPFPHSSPTSPRFHPYARPSGMAPIPSPSPGSLASLGLPPGYLNPYASLYPGLFSSRPSML